MKDNVIENKSTHLKDYKLTADALSIRPTRPAWKVLIENEEATDYSEEKFGERKELSIKNWLNGETKILDGRNLTHLPQRGENTWKEITTDPHHHDKKFFRYIVHATIHAETPMLDFHNNCHIINNIHSRPLISTSFITDFHIETYLSSGYILKVPVENIILTYCNDSFTPCITGDYFESDYDALLWVKQQLHSKKVMSPIELLGKTHPFEINEVLVTGTNPYDCSKKIKVEALFTHDNITNSSLEFMHTLSTALNIPIIQFKSPTYNESKSYDDLQRERTQNIISLFQKYTSEPTPFDIAL